MLKVYYADISDAPEEWSELCLSVYRLNKLKKQKLSQKIKQSIGAELLLIHVLKALYPDLELPLNIVSGKYGKPEIPSLPFHFNLSHSGKYAVCAVSDSEIGVDVEADPRYVRAVAEHFFTEEERFALGIAEDIDKCFGRIWTAKESAIKCIGTGMHTALSTVSAHEKGFVEIPDYDKLSCYHNFTENICIAVCSFSSIEKAEFIKINLF